MKRNMGIVGVGLLLSLVVQPAGASPYLWSAKSDSLDVAVSPGDTLRYTIKVVNSGTTNALGVSVHDAIDFQTTLVPGSLAAIPTAAKDSYNAVDGTELIVPDGPGDILDNDFPGLPDAGVLVSFGGGTLGGTVADHPAGSTAVGDDFSLTVRSDGSLSFVPTGVLGGIFFEYRVVNSAGMMEGNVSISTSSSGVETGPANRASVSSTPSCGRDTSGDLEICLGVLSPGGISDGAPGVEVAYVAKISFSVVVNCSVPDNYGQVCNQAVVFADNHASVLSDDTTVGGATDPTCTVIAHEQLCDVTAAGPRTGLHSAELRPNVPNPFNPSTEIHFELAAPKRATLSIFDLSGRLVRTLVDGSLGAGPHFYIWNGKDDARRQVSSGVYLYRLEAGDYAETRRMALLK